MKIKINWFNLGALLLSVVIFYSMLFGVYFLVYKSLTGFPHEVFIYTSLSTIPILLLLFLIKNEGFYEIVRKERQNEK
jgi:hypothetical protein